MMDNSFLAGVSLFSVVTLRSSGIMTLRESTPIVRSLASRMQHFIT